MTRNICSIDLRQGSTSVREIDTVDTRPIFLTWIIDDDLETAGVTQQFIEFIRRSGKYPSLDLGQESELEGNQAFKRKIILIDDIPFLYNDKLRACFQNFLLFTLNSPEKVLVPIVLIISDTYYDQSEARFFLGVDVMDHPFCTMIR